MSTEQAADLDLFARQGVSTGKSWAIGCLPRELYLLARHAQEAADLDPHRLAVAIYQSQTEAQAVRNLWLGRWPIALDVERSDAADAFVAGFVDGAMQVWRMLFARFSGPAPRLNHVFVPEPEPEQPKPEPKPRSARCHGGPERVAIKRIDLESGEIHRYASITAAVSGSSLSTSSPPSVVLSRRSDSLSSVSPRCEFRRSAIPRAAGGSFRFSHRHHPAGR